MSFYHQSADFPQPDVDAITISERLIEVILERIWEHGGCLPFDEYMQMCLYTPGLGYYSAGSCKFGPQGDFVTAPEISPLFGQTLAQLAADLFNQGVVPAILEFGAGSGRLCVDIIQRLKQLDQPLQQYLILETSADLRERQQSYLRAVLSEQEFLSVRWLDRLPEEFAGLVLGNEILDALPVHRLKTVEGQWMEQGVGFDGKQFYWCNCCCSKVAGLLAHRIPPGQMPDGYMTEFNSAFVPWFNSLSIAMTRGVILLIDYGYNSSLYYHPQRQSGTLSCFYRHRVHDDPFVFPGLQDITAFVEFDLAAEAASQASFDVLGIREQGGFLLANGLPQLLARSDIGATEMLAVSQQVKTLTLPEEMGEKFKVLALQKGGCFNIPGF